ncbi:histidine kinase [Streptomyces sp. NPDC048057]|uniref:sensor histidine kinase n=1 Tax=Streptomyces sp. NPDC048057 TaxID=3155628 RepID=UPI0033D50320
MTAHGRPKAALVGRDGLAVAAYLLLVSTTGAAGSTGAGSSALPDGLASLLVLVTVAPLVVRRLWPLPVFGGVLAATCVGVLLGAVHDPFVPAAFALYTVAVQGAREHWWQRWLPALAVGALSLCALVAPLREGRGAWWTSGPGLLVLGFGVLLGAWELGRAASERRAFAIRTAEQLAQRAVTEERLRIARELHDVVTHSIGLIVVKAGVANHVVRTRPDAANDALRVIEGTGRDALTELRRMLGVLRASDTGERVPAQLAPAPTVAELPELAARAGAELTVGDLEGLPEGVGLAVYRIVQESLTNVLRHAGPGTPCRVAVDSDGTAVRLVVADDGPPGGPAPDGHGIVGMRERVALYGGVFAAGPRAPRGFEVRATIPYERVHRPGGEPAPEPEAARAHVEVGP